MKKSLNFTSALTVILLLITMSQASADQPQVLIDVQHDSSRSVTCWITQQGGISCLPDSSLLQTPNSSATDESQAARASLATSMCQNEQLTATPLPQKKGFQL